MGDKVCAAGRRFGAAEVGRRRNPLRRKDLEIPCCCAAKEQEFRAEGKKLLDESLVKVAGESLERIAVEVKHDRGLVAPRQPV